MRVSLGVTGCIAAYKAVEVLRGLQKRGAAVQVVMTRHATEFVGPLTFQAISGHPVIADMFAPTTDPEIKHIHLAQEIDLLLVAPATANALAKFANGITDDFLSTLYISTTAPVLIAPAMNVEMWAHPATRANVHKLRERGVQFVDPEEGYLACRTVGPGRLAEPQLIIERALDLLRKRKSPDADLAGERVLITAGPTYEAIDPVRGITNRSSGKMGYAIAEAALARGADITLVTGPVTLDPPEGARTLRVKSAADMFEAVMSNVDEASIVVMAAAVADYRPESVSEQKVKKSGRRLVIEFEETVDILSAVAKLKGSRFLVGFAAETENVLANARKKLLEKGADLIVANDVSQSESGFEVDANRVTLVSSEGTQDVPLMTKRQVADQILDCVLRIRRSPVSA